MSDEQKAAYVRWVWTLASRQLDASVAIKFVEPMRVSSTETLASLFDFFANMAKDFGKEEKASV